MSVTTTAANGPILLTATGIQVTGTIAMVDGSSSSLSAYFASETNTGFYRVGTGRWAIQCSGNLTADFSSASLAMGTSGTAAYTIARGQSTTASLVLKGEPTNNVGAILTLYSKNHATLGGRAVLATDTTAAMTMLSSGVIVANVALGLGNSAAATGPVGNVVGKAQVTNGSGSNIGYLAIYDAVT